MPAAKCTTRLRVRVRSGPKNADALGSGFERDFDAPAWPLTLALKPKAGDSTRRHEVLARAFEGDNEIGRERAPSTFVDRKVVVLTMLLEDACIGVLCSDGETCASSAIDVFHTHRRDGVGPDHPHDTQFSLLPSAGGPERLLGNNAPNGPIAMAADAQTLYYGGNRLYAVPLAGGTPRKLWPNTDAPEDVRAVAVDDEHIYFAASYSDQGWDKRGYAWRIPQGWGHGRARWRRRHRLHGQR